MQILRKHHHHIPWFLLAVGAITTILWFLVFPLKLPFDMQDVLIEGLILCTFISAYYYVHRLQIPLLEAGFGILIFGYLIDFFDEFTKEPDILNTQIEGALKIIGVIVIVAGLSYANKQYSRYIAEAEERERKLAETGAMYRDLVENIFDVLCETDAAGTIRYVSPQVETLLDYRPDDLVGTSMYELIPEANRAGAVDDFIRVRQEGASFQLAEHPLARRDGKIIVAQMNGTPIIQGTGDGGYRMVCRDITGKRQAEDALRLANRKLNLLSSITRHDVLNQLTVLLGYMEIMSGAEDAPERVLYLKKMNTAALSIRQLIEFTKDYQDIGVHAPDWQNCAQTVKSAAKMAGTNLVAGGDGLENLEVFADPLMEKVLYTLFENALRHGGAVTKIAVNARVHGDRCILSVTDDGKGIPAAEKELIFHRQYGVNTGYGLFLAREVLSITGISISETGTEGEGASFELNIPPGTWRYESADRI
ncbi:hypothetical protein AZH53_10940 [Methanomicrobiaceae archaeon CYW5]|uniref:PAS domain-containing sensor histidine kinase n=1 Tax=Methanovulcanius yangii TaxID=1789227 RepID=UPI0029CA2DE8|nr:PAS domain-containing sensor histidine kinase [Methanovulcanius yangii]MBT8508920.1 hypothetical protein [Methanovulcanius yangii]